jgi:integrase
VDETSMRVYIERDRERLRIRVIYRGKKYQFSTGLKDTRTNRAFVQGIVSRIELDMVSGRFDTTLVAYRPQAVGSNPAGLSCSELFQKFMQHKLKDCGVSSRSIETRYKPLLRYLERSLNCPAHEVTEQKAKNFKSILLENLTPSTAKAHLWLLQSSWSWSKGKYHSGEGNPWEGLASGIKRQPIQKPKSFTIAEIQAILGAFRSHRYYSHYTDYVAFLFGVATRPGEAAALRWDAISPDFQTVWIGRSYSRGHYGTTKTGKDRTVILSPSISKMLCDRHSRTNPQPTDLVFPSPKGLPICDRNFRNRAWVTILAECNIPYRKPYNTRRSAITHALKNRANYLEVAEAAGHNPEIMYEHYLDAIQEKGIFVEF